MNRERKVPRRRFREFVNGQEWKCNRLEELCSIITKQTGFDYSATIKPSLELEASDTNYPFIQNKDFSGMNINLKTDFFIPKDIAEKFPKILLDRTSILISISGKIGNVGLYRLKNKAFIGGAVGICKLLDESNGELIVYELLSNKGQSNFLSLIKASSHSNITVEDIRNLPINIPNLSKEKKLISDFFVNLDNNLVIQRHKLEKLKALKKAYLTQMFPSVGECKPKLRFAGFNDEWEQSKFQDNIISIQTGSNLLGSANNSGTPLLKMGNIQRGYFSLEKLEYLDKSIEIEKENIAYYGDFLFNTRNTLELVGKGATWIGASGKYGFNSNIARFKFKGIDTIFFNYLYNTTQIIKQVRARATGTTSVAAIYPASLNSLEYMLPIIKEQKKIGEFLLKMDKIINLYNRKLEKLQNLKKAYLNEMFI